MFFYPLDSVSLLTGARSSSLGNSFWTSITVFGVFCYFHFVIKTLATCRPKSRFQSDLSTVSVLANNNLHQNLMHSGCRWTAVPNVCLQAFSLFPLPSSPLDQRPVHRLISSCHFDAFLSVKSNPWTAKLKVKNDQFCQGVASFPNHPCPLLSNGFHASDFSFFYY